MLAARALPPLLPNCCAALFTIIYLSSNVALRSLCSVSDSALNVKDIRLKTQSLELSH
jgi:hypothetical protein